MYFRVTTHSDTAGKDDFGSVVKNVTFQPGEKGPKLVRIPLIDDADDEPTEKFPVSLSSDARVILGDPASINIQDNDGNNSIITFFVTINALICILYLLPWYPKFLFKIL